MLGGTLQGKGGVGSRQVLQERRWLIGNAYTQIVRDMYKQIDLRTYEIPCVFSLFTIGERRQLGNCRLKAHL
jgi:hypothetical protein